MRRAIVNVGLLLSGLFLVFSGLLIQAGYHMAGHGEIDTSKSSLGLGYSMWSGIHTISAILVSGWMVLHIIQHWNWYKAVFKKQLFSKNRQVITLSLVFPIVAVSGFIPWIIHLNDGNETIRKTIIEIHDKIALILCIYLIFHVVKRFKWYLSYVKN